MAATHATGSETSDLLMAAWHSRVHLRQEQTLSRNRPKALTSGNKPRTAAKAETMGYARASRRAFDWQPRGRLGSEVSCPAL